MSVALCGLENMTFPDAPGWFEIEVVLDKPWSQEYALSEKHLRLHCTPVINLFPLESDPLHLDSLQSEYLLRPMRVQMDTPKSIRWSPSPLHVFPAPKCMCRLPVFATKAACCAMMRRNIITTRALNVARPGCMILADAGRRGV